MVSPARNSNFYPFEPVWDMLDRWIDLPTWKNSVLLNVMDWIRIICYTRYSPVECWLLILVILFTNICIDTVLEITSLLISYSSVDNHLCYYLRIISNDTLHIIHVYIEIPLISPLRHFGCVKIHAHNKWCFLVTLVNCSYSFWTPF